MAEQTQERSVQHRTTLGRPERAHRILDAAAELIRRWGYNKTTIDDIAKQAGVGKGTIYLHWKTREELFRALIQREQLEMGADLKQRIADDSNGATLRGIFKHTALALIKRPLMKAFILRDIQVLGKLAHSEQSNAAYVERLAGFKAYLDFLGQYNLVRKDLNVRAQVYMISAIFMGFFLVAPLMPDDLTLTDEELANMIGETVYRSLESGHSPSSDELQTISNTFLDYMGHGLTMAEEQFQRELEA